MGHAVFAPSPPSCFSTPHAIQAKSKRAHALPPRSHSSSVASTLLSSFVSGSPHSLGITSRRRNVTCRTASFTVRCEQGTKQSGGVDIWLGRLAMVGFASAVTVEIVTGKGLLENFGFAAPIPTLALVVTALVGVLTAFFIFQSASRD